MGDYKTTALIVLFVHPVSVEYTNWAFMLILRREIVYEQDA